MSSYTVVFKENDISCFSDNVYLLKYFSIKVPQNLFDLFNCTNQTDMQISEFLFALDKYKKLI